VPTHIETEAAAQAARAGATKSIGRRILGQGPGVVILGAFEALDTSRPVSHRVGGFTGGVVGMGVGPVAGVAIGTAIGGPVGTAVGWVAGSAIELGAYYAFEHTFGAVEEANKRDRERMRTATRVGFQVSDTFQNNSRMALSQRQASLRAIQGSMLNARSSIGNEASMMRRSVDEYLEG